MYSTAQLMMDELNLCLIVGSLYLFGHYLSHLTNLGTLFQSFSEKKINLSCSEEKEGGCSPTHYDCLIFQEAPIVMLLHGTWKVHVAFLLFAFSSSQMIRLEKKTLSPSAGLQLCPKQHMCFFAAGLVHGRYICSQLSDGQDRIVQGEQFNKRRNIIENSVIFLIFLPAITVCSTSRTWRYANH